MGPETDPSCSSQEREKTMKDRLPNNGLGYGRMREYIGVFLDGKLLRSDRDDRKGDYRISDDGQVIDVYHIFDPGSELTITDFQCVRWVYKAGTWTVL